MTQSAYYVVCLIIYLFNLFVVQRFMCVFFDKRSSPLWRSMLSYGGYFVVTSISYMLINIPIVTLVCNIAGLCMIAFNYEATIKKRLFSVLFIYLFLFLSELIVVIFSGIFEINVAEKAEYIDIVWHVIIQLTTFLAAILAGSFKNMKKHKPLSNEFCLTGIIIFAISVYLVLTVLGSNNSTQIRAIMTIAAIFTMNIVVFYLYDRLSEAYTEKIDTELAKKEREFYYNQCEIMKTGTKELSEFRHDIKNHLSIMNDLLQKKRFAETAEYLLGLTEKVSTDTIFCDTGNTVIDSIVNYSFRNASAQGINVKVLAKIPEKIEMNVADIVTILSNLFDNAITATLKLSENRMIEVKISYSKCRLFIFVQNTYNGIVKYQNGKIITTKEKEEGHGIGIESVRSIIEKYDGYLSLEHTDEIFSADTILYLREPLKSE